MGKKKSWLWICLLFILCLIISACSGEKDQDVDAKEDDTQDENDITEENNPTRGGTLSFAFNAQPPTLDPAATTATATRDISRNIFEQLVTFDSNMNVQPMLAESFEVDVEGNKVVFKLREGIKFHNGEEMTQEDVIASMEMWAGKSAQAKSFLEGITFESGDDNTVVAQLEKTGSIDMFVFADVTQIAAIMPKEIVEAATESGVTEYIGTGPYKLEEWRQDQHIKLTRFEDYQSRNEPADGLSGEKNAYVDEIVFEFVTDPSTRVSGLQAGNYHIGNFIPYDNAEQLEKDTEVENSINQASFPGIVFNKKQGLFSNILMRKAVAAALNIEDLMFATYGNEKFFGLNHELMLKEQTDWYTDAGSDQYNQKDPEKAKKLLEEAGYKGEEIRILTSREYDDYYTIAVVTQQQLKEIGMNVTLEVYDWSSVLEKRANPDAYEMFISGWALRPTPIQYPFLDSQAEWPGWTASDEMDRLIEEIINATNQEEIVALTAEFQKEFWDYLPIIKPGNSVEISSYRTEIEGFDYLVGPILWNVTINE
ncbi:ABC transporter substrate-binding protein [Sporosarcina siberiensis]|uniref:ABC transporter substrate-binding protein n=1 Tax=Sporosarcina siberiensis TaxID=1365606 RepID=A0ABW4SI44_9BACL